MCGLESSQHLLPKSPGPSPMCLHSAFSKLAALVLVPSPQSTVLFTLEFHVCPQCSSLVPSIFWQVNYYISMRSQFRYHILKDSMPGNLKELKTSVQFSSVAQSCLTLCDFMEYNMPGLPVHHQLPEFTQTHVH